MNFLKMVFRHLFTGKDNQTYNLGKVMWAWSVLAVIVSGQYELFMSKTFDLKGYAFALAAVLGAGGAAIAAMSASKSEPEHPGDAP